MNVKQRHHAQGDILGRELVGLSHIARRGHQSGMRERDARGTAGRPARMQDQRGIIRVGIITNAGSAGILRR